MTAYGYLPTGFWGASSDNYHSPQWCDGRYIWVFNKGGPLERFDTETLYLERISFLQPATGASPVDSHSPLTASIQYSSLSHVTGDDEFMYWIEPFKRTTTSSDGYLGILRRMSLTEPHFVETVDNGWDTPDGYVSGTGTSPFHGLDGSDSVFVKGTGSSTITNGLAIYQDYLYFSTVVFDAAGSHVFRISRWPMSGGDIQPLYEIYPEDEETGDSNVTEVRGSGWSFPFHGMGGPDLEGFDLGRSKFTVVGDDLIVCNESTVTFGGGHYCNAINVAFNIPELLTATADGPLRHDRANPWYTTINGGSGNFESYSDFNYAVSDRYYAVRDGNKPLLDTHLISSATAGRGPLDGSLVLASSALFSSLQEYNANIFVHRLDPAASATGAEWNITLAFEGKALQGYGRQSILHGKEAPEEVELT